MKGFLSSLLREVGNSVRYGDAKCVVIAGVSFTLLMSYVQYLLAEPGKTWGIILSHDLSDLGGKDLFIVFLLFVSFVLSSLAFIPSISTRSHRIGFINWINKILRQGEGSPGNYSVVYFRDIAMHDTFEEYGASLEEKFDSGCDLDRVEFDLATQVWMVSRIATAKFVIANFAVYFLFSAMALFFVLLVL